MNKQQSLLRRCATRVSLLHHLGKAERLILKSRSNTPQVQALISLYDRVLAAAEDLGGTIPIEQNCREMKKLLQKSIGVSPEFPNMAPSDQRSRASADSAEARELAQICYVIAYIFMPKCVHSDPKMTIDYFSKPPQEAAALWYWTGCKIRRTNPSHDHASQFHVHTGSIFDQANCYILEYPKPPPFDQEKFLQLSQMGSPTAFTSYGAPCLAPYFSAIVHQIAIGQFGYFVMGQGFDGTTTLRSVRPQGSKVNLGSGSEPTLDGFLSDLRRISR